MSILEVLFEKAIQRCGLIINKEIKKILKGVEISLDDLKVSLKHTISGFVAIGGNEYYGYYLVTSGDFVFETQTIDLNDGARFMIENSEIIKLLYLWSIFANDLATCFPTRPRMGARIRRQTITPAIAQSVRKRRRITRSAND